MEEQLMRDASLEEALPKYEKLVLTAEAEAEALEERNEFIKPIAIASVALSVTYADGRIDNIPMDPSAEQFRQELPGLYALLTELQQEHSIDRLELYLAQKYEGYPGVPLCRIDEEMLLTPDNEGPKQKQLLNFASFMHGKEYSFKDFMDIYLTPWEAVEFIIGFESHRQQKKERK